VAGDLDTSTALSSAPRRFALDGLLANRRWVHRTRPFPHVYARDVFNADFYRSLHEEFERIERDEPETFLRNMGDYDASGATLDQFRHGPLGVFVSRDWHDMIAAVAGVQATGDINATLHHHDPGSAGGWPHNDLNPSTFAGPPPGPDEVRLGGDGGVGVVSGDRPEGTPAREVIRAVSLLFYLGNPEWESGDGGETGLFNDIATAAAGPARAVPPINNSLVMFECTPRSWHAFVSNRVKPRNSVVMWLHRAKDEVVERWGDERIAYWK
jgi:hypothetical protein